MDVMIVRIPLVGFANTMCRHYREICVVNDAGFIIEKDMADGNDEVVSGKRYKRVDH